MGKYLSYLRTVLRHKYYVMSACFTVGLYWQGIVHDLSKFSFIEFRAYANYFNVYLPIRSIIDNYGSAVKYIEDFEKAWQHHKDCNAHHWEHWVDVVDGKLVPRDIPYKYLMEMLCDWVGAGKAYNKEKWTKEEPYKYWLANNQDYNLHENVRLFLEHMTWIISIYGVKIGTQGALNVYEDIKSGQFQEDMADLASLYGDKN